MNKQEENYEESILASQIKTAGQSYFLSATRAHQIVSQLKAPTLSPLSSHFKRRDQGRSIISKFITQIDIIMSTTAKVGLVALVLGLVAIFGYTQLGSQPADYASSPEDNTQTASGVAKGSGDIDSAVGVMLASAASESLVLGEEDADATLIASDSQELLDLSQSINDNDF